MTLDPAHHLADDAGMGHQDQPFSFVELRDVAQCFQDAVAELAIAFAARPAKLGIRLFEIALPVIRKALFHLAERKPVRPSTVYLRERFGYVDFEVAAPRYDSSGGEGTIEGTRINVGKWPQIGEMRRDGFSLAKSDGTKPDVGVAAHGRIGVPAVRFGVSVSNEDEFGLPEHPKSVKPFLTGSSGSAFVSARPKCDRLGAPRNVITSPRNQSGRRGSAPLIQVANLAQWESVARQNIRE